MFIEIMGSDMGRQTGPHFPIHKHIFPTWTLIILACVIIPNGTANKRYRDDLIINTEQGHVRGQRYYLPHLGKAVDAFLGIPFAAPPVNHLRFRPPQPVQPWEGIYNATKLPNSCYQLPDEFFGDFRGSAMWNPNTRVSEDCLYLNVWVPKTQPRLRKSAVMVWIYGGGFYSGTTTLNVYDGKILAATHDIIVVSIAYRVGALGFLSLGHPSAPGNAGLFDQLMGLDWVQQNIGYFGGDPTNVTLFGESAGAVSVSMHLLSPLSRTKFQRAILQSGVANVPWATLPMSEARRRGLELAIDYLDCPESNNMDAIIECLRNIPPQNLVENEWVTRGILSLPFLPVIDGAFLNEHPETSLKRKHFKKCPILIGSNKNEGMVFLFYELYEQITLTNQPQLSREQYLAAIVQLFHYYPQYPWVINKFGLEAISHQYSSWLEPQDHVYNLDQAVGDYFFTCPTNAFADHYAQSGENVFSYYFTHRSSVQPWPEWAGVLHADEVPFTFGVPLKAGYNQSEADKEMSQQIMQYWTNFAKTGDPNVSPGGGNLNRWPIYTTSGKEYLELNGAHLQQDLDSVGRGLRVKECAFWGQYLPNLLTNIEQLERRCSG